MPFFFDVKPQKKIISHIGDIDSIKKYLQNGRSLSKNLPSHRGKVGKSLEEINTQNVIALLKGRIPTYRTST
jgi:hypothetical protein